MAVDPNLVAIEPRQLPEFIAAATDAGAQVSPLTHEVGALIWTDYHHPEQLAAHLATNPQLEWVQLPWAGVDAFANIISHPVRFTSAKGSYREPVAEHALMLCMALGRRLAERVRAKTWGEKWAVSLYDSNVVIVGGGGIAQELLLQLQPFRASVTVVRRHPAPMSGAARVVGLDQLDEVLPAAQFVVLACALTDETRGLFDAKRLALLDASAYLVNVSRGPVIDTMALIAALNAWQLAGAGIDVTDPEPLPEGHPGWECENLIVTPHTADTPVQVNHFFAIRIGQNVRAYLNRGDWVGTVDPKLGY